MSQESTAIAREDMGGKPPSAAGIFNVFIDPAATARSVPAPRAWLAPLIVISIATVLYAWFTIPITMRVIMLNPPNGASGENLERMRGIMETTYKVFAFASPAIVIGMIALLALLVSLMCSALSVKTKFRDVFTLLSACSLITVLQLAAMYFVLRAKGDDLQSVQQLSPSFGLDIFFSDLKGPLFAILNFFSIFEVWYLVMLALSLAYLTRSSKGKAFLAITPAWLLPLLFKVVGSFFAKS